MKNLSPFTFLAPTCGLALLSFSAQAQHQVPVPTYSSPQSRGPIQRFYLRGDVGGGVTLDTSVREFFGEPLAPGSKVVFDPGIRFGVAAGYDVTDWFSVEAQSGVMASRVDSITGASRVDDVFFSQIPLLGNIKLQLPGNCRFTPYIGGGVGMSTAVISADHLDIGGTTMHGDGEGDVVFAYQAFGGFRFRINDNMSVSVEYHYFAADAPEWQADTSGTSSDKIRFGRTETHTGTVAFTYTF